MLENHDFMRFKGVLNVDKDDTRYSCDSSGGFSFLTYLLDIRCRAYIRPSSSHRTSYGTRMPSSASRASCS
jgi:hypothetical protein